MRYPGLECEKFVNPNGVAHYYGMNIMHEIDRNPSWKKSNVFFKSGCIIVLMFWVSILASTLAWLILGVFLVDFLSVPTQPVELMLDVARLAIIAFIPGACVGLFIRRQYNKQNPTTVKRIAKIDVFFKGGIIWAIVFTTALLAFYLLPDISSFPYALVLAVVYTAIFVAGGLIGLHMQKKFIHHSKHGNTPTKETDP